MSSPDRRARPAILLAALAIAAVVSVVLLGFRTTSSVPAGVPAGADLIGVTDTPVSRPVQPGFVGLSLEFTAVKQYAGTDRGAINPALVRLVRNLAPNGRPVLRIGGDSSDWGWWPIPGVARPNGIRFSLHRRFLQVTQALARETNAQLILGLNLEARSRRLMAAEARAFQRIGPAVRAFEIGNEPELFGAIPWYVTHHHPVYGRPHRYGYKAFVREFTSFSKVIPHSIPLAGPASGGTKFWEQTANFLKQQPRVRIVTFHQYPLHRCFVGPRSPFTPTIDHLLAPAATGGLASAIAPYVAVAHAHGAQLRIGEMNNVSCSGAAGVSDRFVSALWALDMLFHLAQEGVDGVNIHTFNRAYYRTFSARQSNGGWTMHVAPEYYGLLAFARAAPPGSRLLSVGPVADPSLRVWATRAPDGRVRAVLINASRRRARTVAIKLPSGRGPRARLERLSAPNLDASDGVTLGGQSFAPNTTTGELTGSPDRAHPAEVQRGVYVIRVPAGSAAILTR